MRRFMSLEPVEKGWSGDKKYRATDAEGRRWLLRVAPLERYARKRGEYAWMRRVAALDVPICRPAAFWRGGDGVYTLLDWINGDDAMLCVPALPEPRQYALGLEAGGILRRIHSLPAPEGQAPWASRFSAKIERKLRLYADCPVKCENGQAFIAYIEANRGLLDGRPQCFQHGDYHIGNMMLGGDGRLYIIDFDRWDLGDPWEEFNRIVWSAQASAPFARGLVDGYFPKGVPPAFWRLMALYISGNMLSSVAWAIPYGQEEVEIMLRQAREVLGWYDGMRTAVPSWYAAGP